MSTTKKIIPNPYEEIARFHDGMFNFNYADCKNWLEKLGKKQYGPHFHIDPQDNGLVFSLLAYAIGDKPTLQKRGYDLDKGILLSGPIGAGKTVLMSLVKHFFPRDRQYRIKPARNVSFEYERSGFRSIALYMGEKVPGLRGGYNPIYCFDDLGIELPQKHYGNECDVMGEVLLSRYDLFVNEKVPTHATTNLSATEIENRYGNRVRSRMREMFNLFAFGTGANDKRI